MKLSDRFTSYEKFDPGKIHPTELLPYHRRGCLANKGRDCSCGLINARGTISRILERGEAIEEAIEEIRGWNEEAYPLDIFPEADLKKARALLEAGGMTIDSVSASIMRFALSRVVEILNKAIDPESEKESQE